MRYFLFLLIPLVFTFALGFAEPASAQGFDLIVCGTDTNGDGTVSGTEQCNFGHLITLSQNVIRALVLLSSFLAVIAFIYAGFLLMTSGGDMTKKNHAKDIFKKVFIGYLWILAAWLIVYTITSLLAPGFSLITR